jgi:L-ascorbate metabolism protein UlaG (beta-lactamase superfamily)
MKLKSLIVTLFSMAVMVTCTACNGNENTNADDIVAPNNTAPADSTVQILYMGQASIRIVTEQNKVIYIDPYAGNSYTLSADLILVTHEHYDHNAIDRVEYRQPHCRIIRSRDAMIDGIHQTFDMEYVRVEAVEAGFNRLHDVRECVGYVLTFNNGKKVYISGDTSTTDQMQGMSEMHIDYAFLCTDGIYNMGNEEAARVAGMIDARHNIPYHNSASGQGDMFDRDAAERFSAPNKLIILPGETIIIE